MSGKPKCPHDRNRYACMLCNPILKCEHFLLKTTCMKCNPRLRCQHDTRESQCMVCNPHLKCQHDIRRCLCAECNPSLICQHGKNKLNCSERECNPNKKSNKKCETHNKVMCLECKPSLACRRHPQFRRYRCPVCGGSGTCRHGKQKESCGQCRDEGNPGISFCKKTSILKRDCPCETCRYKRLVRGGIIKNKDTGRALYKEQPQAQQGAVVLQAHEVQGVAQQQEQGEGHDGWYDSDNAGGVFTNEINEDDEGWITAEEGGRKQRFTRRLRRRNHNTKKSKIVKRKITKHSRKNKYKLK